jgi:hypothetical protein
VIHYREECDGHETLTGAIGDTVTCDGSCESTACGKRSIGSDGTTDDTDEVTCMACLVALGVIDAPHTGHYSHISGTWWCDTCDSPYCELA